MTTFYIYNNKKRIKNLARILYTNDFKITKSNKKNILVNINCLTTSREFHCKKVKCTARKVYLILEEAL